MIKHLFAQKDIAIKNVADLIIKSATSLIESGHQDHRASEEAIQILCDIYSSEYYQIGEVKAIEFADIVNDKIIEKCRNELGIVPNELIAYLGTASRAFIAGLAYRDIK